MSKAKGLGPDTSRSLSQVQAEAAPECSYWGLI
jgi:hypothetical protein